jgi:hypothetical protein
MCGRRPRRRRPAPSRGDLRTSGPVPRCPRGRDRWPAPPDGRGIYPPRSPAILTRQVAAGPVPPVAFGAELRSQGAGRTPCDSGCLRRAPAPNVPRLPEVRMRILSPRPLAAAALAALAACSRPRREGLAAAGVGGASRRPRRRPAARLETALARATGTVRAREEATLSARATGQGGAHRRRRRRPGAGRRQAGGDGPRLPGSASSTPGPWSGWRPPGSPTPSASWRGAGCCTDEGAFPRPSREGPRPGASRAAQRDQARAALRAPSGRWPTPR